MLVRGIGFDPYPIHHVEQNGFQPSTFNLAQRGHNQGIARGFLVRRWAHPAGALVISDEIYQNWNMSQVYWFVPSSGLCISTSKGWKK